jgi:dUTP pyrophosphatase
MQLRGRSGLAAKHGVGLVNGVGTIDSDYRGEVHVILINHGDEPFAIQHGDRIAQGVIARYEQVTWELTDTLEETARGQGGFGSTGKG